MDIMMMIFLLHYIFVKYNFRGFVLNLNKIE